MPNKTLIEWTTYTSNPIAPAGGGWGCSKVSPGCAHCYAERLNKRMGNHRDFQGRWEFALKRKELDGLKRLNDRVGDLGIPTYVFLGDMTDIFHPDVPFEMLVELFLVLDECGNLIIQSLTKRPGRMAYFANHVLGGKWPANVWAGTSVESQKYAPRLDVLARVPAKVRFVSYEPALGPVDFGPWLECPHLCLDECGWDNLEREYHSVACATDAQLHWVIYGGESGPGARPMDPVWARSIRDQCIAAGTPQFFKQWGEWIPFGQLEVGPQMATFNQMSLRETGERIYLDGEYIVRLGKKAAGAVLDGREWRELPTSVAVESFSISESSQ